MQDRNVTCSVSAALWLAPDPYTRAAQLGGLFVAAIGGAALVGWATGSTLFNAGRSGLIPVAPNTGLLLVLLGVSLSAVAARGRPMRLMRRSAIAISFIVASTRQVRGGYEQIELRQLPYLDFLV